MRVLPFENSGDAGICRVVVAENPKGPGVYLLVVDAQGVEKFGGALVLLTNKGVELCEGVDPRLGFPLDEDGRLKILSALPL